MKRRLLLGALVAFCFGVNAQQKHFFNEVSKASLEAKSSSERTISPKEYKVFSLNLEALSSEVKNVGSRIGARATQKYVNFPNEKGISESFAIYDSEVMHPELQAKYPQIRSYFGVSQENPLNKVYFTITPQGLRGIIKG